MHAAVAAKAMDAELTQQVLDDYTTAPIDEKLRATLGFLRKLTLRPEEIGPEDLRALLELGLSREAVVDAIYVGFVFNLVDRLADGMGWEIPSSGAFAFSAKILLRRGYR